MVSVPNSLSNNAVMFQKAKSAPQAIAKNIKAPTQKAKPINIPELGDVTDKEVAFLRQAKAQGMDQQGALDYIKEKRKPTLVQKVVQGAKDVVGGLAGGIPNFGPTIVGGAMQSIGSMGIAPGMDLQTPATKAIQSTGKELSDRGIQMRDIAEKAVGARPEATGTQIGRMGVPIAASVIGGGALGLTKAGAGALQTVKTGLATRSVPAVLKGIAGSAAVGGAGQGIYDIASEGKTSPESVAIGGAIGGGLATLPILSKVAKAVTKPIAKGAGKLAERMATKGLMNVVDARNALRTLGETADNDAGAIGRWLLNKKVVGGSESSVIKKLGEVSQKQYDNVRKVVGRLDNQGAVGVDKNVENAMTIVAKQIDSINARAGVEIMSRQQADDILRAAQQGTLSYTQKQQAKELMDEFVSIYKKSGDTADSLLAKAAEPVRNKIKVDLEDAATKFTNGKVNLREMNRDVAFAKSVEKAIETKQVANDLKQYVIQGSIGALTNQGDFSSPEGWAKFVVGAFLGRQAGRLLGSPAFNSNVAKIIDKLSFGTRDALIKYAKAPTVAKLSTMQLDELLKAKQEIQSLASSLPDGNIMSPSMASVKVPTNMPSVLSNMTKGLDKVPNKLKKLVAEKKTTLKQASDTPKLSPKTPKVLKAPTPLSKVDDALPVLEKMKQSAKSLDKIDNSSMVEEARKYESVENIKTLPTRDFTGPEMEELSNNIRTEASIERAKGLFSKDGPYKGKTPPVEVTISKDGSFIINDGHHRSMAGYILNQEIPVKVVRNDLKPETLGKYIALQKQGLKKSQIYKSREPGTFDEQVAKKFAQTTPTTTPALGKPLVKANVTDTPDLTTSIKKAKAEGKSFDVFLSSQEKEGKILYHGTDADIKEFSSDFIGKGGDVLRVEGAGLGKGIYLTNKQQEAKYYADLVANQNRDRNFRDKHSDYTKKIEEMFDKGEITKEQATEMYTKGGPMRSEFERSKNIVKSVVNGKIATKKDIEGIFGSKLPKKYIDDGFGKRVQIIDQEKINNSLKDKGFVGREEMYTMAGQKLGGRDEAKNIVIFDPKQIKTEAQLRTERDKLDNAGLPALGKTTSKPLVKAKVDDGLIAEARKYKSADEFEKRFRDETYNANNVDTKISDKAKEFNRKYVPLLEDGTTKKYKENIQSIIEDTTLDTDSMLEKIKPIKEKLYNYQKSQLRKIREEANRK